MALEATASISGTVAEANAAVANEMAVAQEARSQLKSVMAQLSADKAMAERQINDLCAQVQDKDRRTSEMLSL